MQNGRIFSIEEFAIHDGPGVRMTIFFKGCPLSCQWCHSPEGQDFAPQLLRSPNGCLGCGACLQAGQRVTGSPTLVPESIAVCPKGLIRLCGEDITSEALCARILRRADFLASAGGGVTFSGGEPLAQTDFLKACLSRLSGKVHCALQTCGFAPPARFAEILPLCDHVLYDLKLMDAQAHKHYCGVDNDRILANYRTLASSGKEFITRIPLIPGVNDTEENLGATARLMQECGVKRVELLPYHPFTGSKYAMTGRVYAPEFDDSRAPTPRTEIFESYDIEVHLL